jgi:hypothetical protein
LVGKIKIGSTGSGSSATAVAIGAVDVASSATAVFDSLGLAIAVVAAAAEAEAAVVAVAGERVALAAGDDVRGVALADGDELCCATGVVGDAQADNTTANASTTSTNERTGRMAASLSSRPNIGMANDTCAERGFSDQAGTCC